MFDLVGYERSEVTGLGFVEWGMGVECDVIPGAEVIMMRFV